MKSLMIKMALVVVMLLLMPTISYGTNESSYRVGYGEGSLKSSYITPGANWLPELDNSCALGDAVTNTTACQDGFFNGYKNWCIKNAVNCIGNIVMGDFPNMLVKTHQEYLRGYNTANGSGSMMCPIGENAIFCQGYNDNNDDYGDWDCSDIYRTYSGPFSNNLIGCPLDVIHANQMAKPHVLIGIWQYLNSSSTSTISGVIKYSNYGNFTLTIPLNSPFGNYELIGSWGYHGHKILTECYAGGCENNTLTAITPNRVDFSDNHHNIIHLMRK